MRALVTLAAIAAFVGFLVWMALQQGGVACEVCMASGGRTHCATVSAGDAAQAEERARQVACGVVGGGMADELACQRGPAVSTRCEN